MNEANRFAYLSLDSAIRSARRQGIIKVLMGVNNKTIMLELTETGMQTFFDLFSQINDEDQK